MAATPVPAPKTRSLVKNETPDQSPLAVSAPTTSRSTPFPPHEEHHPPRRRKPVAIPARTMLPSEDIMMRPSPRTEVDKLKASAHETPTRASDMEQSDAEPSTPGKQKSSRSKDADIRYRKKYSELKRKIAEFEEANAVLAKEYSIARQKISRLRFERSLILERLEEVEIHRPRPAVSDSESGLEHLRPAKKKHRTRTRQPIPPPIPPPPITPATQPRKRAPKKPKEKKPFDPKAPKRPANAFMLFCEMTRQQLKTEREGLDEASIEEKGLGNITKALGMRWQQLTEEGKNVWRNEFQKQVQRYDREMRAYEAANISSPIRVPSPPPFPSEPSMRSDNGHDIPLTSPTAADVHSDVVSHRSDDPNIMNAHSIPGPTSMEGIVGFTFLRHIDHNTRSSPGNSLPKLLLSIRLLAFCKKIHRMCVDVR
ncbi:hypothetical protein BC832DRAFT_270965 [Gaertneriomyces semiglobifer]|nr:hypothetical protein BC832DRAFT_270965 [Gaertneriomyces semiglobifer]